MFESLEKPALKPLAQEAYQYAEWKQAKVNIDYHVELDRHRYSVPHRLIGRRLEIRFTKTTVECFLKGERVAVHPRKYQPGGFTTITEHMPKSLREFVRWTPERIINWMAEIGPSAAKLAQAIIEIRPHPQQGFRSCLGIIGLTKGYPRPRVEAACKRALAINALTYKSIKSILKNNLDSKPMPQAEQDQPALFHDNIRGGGYYASGRRKAMLVNPIIEQLSRMKLQGMVNVLEELMNSTDGQNLSFEEILGLTVDRESLERENRRLTARLRNAKLKMSASIEDIDFRHPRGLEKQEILSLASCRWIKEHLNIIITGPTGVGKTYLACALGHKACLTGHTTLHKRASNFFSEIAVAKGDGSYPKFIKALIKTDLLIIDDFGLECLNKTQALDLLELLEDRYDQKSTLVTAQVPVDQWHGLIGDPTLADAALDRLVHNAYKINLKGESMRKKRAELKNNKLKMA